MKTKYPLNKRGIVRWWLNGIFYGLSLSILLFMSADTLTWRSAWELIFYGLFLTVAKAYTLPMDLKVERSSYQIGTKKWDKWLTTLTWIIGPIGMAIVAGIEHRFSQRLPIPIGIVYLAWGMLICAGLLIVGAMKTNPFYTLTTRIQYERHHRVIDHGVYGRIRHPGYLGGCLMSMAIPLILDSFLALVPGLAMLMGIVLRTYIEDILLTRQFKGYYDYSKRVRYRLIPFVW